jgi:hypothetical protein
MAYDAPEFVTRFERSLGNLTGIASTSMHKSLFFQKAKLKKIHALCITAGTNAAAGVDIYVGTTSVGALTFGTDTAGSTYSSAALDTDIPALGYIELKGKATSATMVHAYLAEYDIYHDAVRS